jgi:Cytochrome c554 and c-prime
VVVRDPVRNSLSFRSWPAVVVALGLGGFIFLHTSRIMARDSPVAKTQISVKTGQYAGSATCESCHEDEYRQWQTSHHKLAERKPNALKDQAAFAVGRAVLAGDHSVIPRRNGSAYQILGTGLNHTQQVFAVSRVIGESPLRQFLTPFSRGRLQALEAAYDPRSNEWFNVYGQENRQPGEWGHWTGRGMNWNSMCAACHNTAVRKNYDSGADSYHTAMAEPTVGCEACHGPLQEHKEWQNQFGASGRKDPTLKKLSPDQVVDNCGFCHARRSELTGAFKPGDDFSDQMHLPMARCTRRTTSTPPFWEAACILAESAAPTATTRIPPRHYCREIGFACDATSAPTPMRP